MEVGGQYKSPHPVKMTVTITNTIKPCAINDKETLSKLRTLERVNIWQIIHLMIN